MTFLNGWAFWMLVPIVLLALSGRYGGSRRRLPLHSKIVLEEGSHSLRRAAQAAALALMVVALARPVMKSTSVAKNYRSAPVYLALDLSASMHATDRKPSRLEYSKEVVRHLLKSDTTHPFGLFGFTSNTLILSPATMDRKLVETALDSINPDFIITHSTSLKALIESVAKMPQKRKRLVVFSDGGDEHDIGDMLRSCREEGIEVYAVEVATKSGAAIPKSGGGFVRDEKGRLIVSMQNPSFGELARLSGGAAIEANNPSEAADELESALDDDDFRSEAEVKVSVTELFWIPLLAALFLYLLSVVRLPERLGKMNMLLAVSAFLGLQHADASILDLWKLHKVYEAYEKGDLNSSLLALHSIKESSLQRSFAEASTLYRLGAYKSSARIFSSIKSTDGPVKSAIYYDLGNCAVKIGRFKAARSYYVKSLQLRPERDTLENLSAILFMEDRRIKKPKPAAGKKPKGASGGEKSRKEGAGKKGESKSSGTGQSGSGGAKKGGKSSGASSKVEALKHPLGSKAYELINKGYIDERKPW